MRKFFPRSWWSVLVFIAPMVQPLTKATSIQGILLYPEQALAKKKSTAAWVRKGIVDGERLWGKKKSREVRLAVVDANPMNLSFPEDGVTYILRPQKKPVQDPRPKDHLSKLLTIIRQEREEGIYCAGYALPSPSVYPENQRGAWYAYLLGHILGSKIDIVNLSTVENTLHFRNFVVALARHHITTVLAAGNQRRNLSELLSQRSLRKQKKLTPLEQSLRSILTSNAPKQGYLVLVSGYQDPETVHPRTNFPGYIKLLQDITVTAPYTVSVMIDDQSSHYHGTSYGAAYVSTLLASLRKDTPRPSKLLFDAAKPKAKPSLWGRGIIEYRAPQERF